jgi:aminopeptidase-like protein
MYEMHKWASDMFLFCRSLTGPGVRDTLKYVNSILPELEVKSFLSGSKVFDWTVPDEWVIHDAYIVDEYGERIVEFSENNLHVVGYSDSVDLWMDLEELDLHLYSLHNQPNAIPYVTTYYSKSWGFCLTHEKRKSLKKCKYHVVINSEHKNGILNYGELIIKGESDKEVLLSTYICHPSMANDNLSGVVVTMALAKWLYSLENRKFTYRLIFIPETIGSLAYLSKNIEHLKGNVVAGYNVTCIGDDRCYSFLPSRSGISISDKAAIHVLKNTDKNYKKYKWLDRGSDERQYCAPGVDLPIASIMRSKYGEYPEYHTSLDDLNVITQSGLDGGFTAIRRAIEVMENNTTPKVTVFGEPQLGKRGLYPNLSIKNSLRHVDVRVMMNFISYCDGLHTLLEISDIINKPFWELLIIMEKLRDHNLITCDDIADATFN